MATVSSYTITGSAEGGSMKLGIVTHRVVKGDGQGRVNYEITREAIRRGYHVTLFSSLVDPELQQNQQITWIPVAVKGIPTALLRNLVFSWRSADLLQNYRSTLDITLVNGAITHASGDVNAVHFVHSAWLRSPAHTSQQRRDLYGLYQWLYTALNAKWEKQAFRQARIVVAVSDKVAQELMNAGVAPEKIQVIANGVDLQEFYPGTVDRHKLGLPENVPLALFVGDIRTPRKNLDTVLKALTQVPELHLAVVGTTEGSPYLQVANQLNLKPRVHFLGYRRDVPEIMRAANFFVFPSRYEACTLALLEAMASGLPVITATTTGTAVAISPEFGLVLSEPDDTPALVAALRQLSNNHELCNRMGQISRAMAEHYSWKTTAEAYINLFETLSLKH